MDVGCVETFVNDADQDRDIDNVALIGNEDDTINRMLDWLKIEKQYEHVVDMSKTAPTYIEGNVICLVPCHIYKEVVFIPRANSSLTDKRGLASYNDICVVYNRTDTSGKNMRIFTCEIASSFVYDPVASYVMISGNKYGNGFLVTLKEFTDCVTNLQINPASFHETVHDKINTVRDILSCIDAKSSRRHAALSIEICKNNNAHVFIQRKNGKISYLTGCTSGDLPEDEPDLC